MLNNREIKFGVAINEAIDLSMAKFPSVFIIGLGVPDPKGVFGTTINLVDKYGNERVLDMPLSENALTGVCIGAALVGLRPILSHQRMDFSLLSMDQIINNASKWYYMFGGQSSVPIVIRVIIGRGWGQGPHHSQNLHALYAHIPGLKVVMPTFPYDVKGLLISSIEDNNPIIFIEHRWLYNIKGYVPKNMYRVPIGKAKIVRKGKDLTIAAASYMTIESIKALNILRKFGVDVELVDIRTIKPLDEDLIINSVKKTGRLLVIDSGWRSGGLAAEVIAIVAERFGNELLYPPQRITLPDIPTPSSKGLTKYYYPSYIDIIKKVLVMMDISQNKKDFNKILQSEKSNIPFDVPDLSFTGPF
jgi:pyruvate dehydrogenase E1 component beta subunit